MRDEDGEYDPPPPAAVFECGDCGKDIVGMYTTQGGNAHVPLTWMHVATRRVECHPDRVAHPAARHDPTETLAAVTLPPDYWDHHRDWPTLPPMDPR